MSPGPEKVTVTKSGEFGKVTGPNVSALIMGDPSGINGPTTVTGGTLQAGAAGAISPNSNVTVGDNGTLDLGGFNLTLAALSGTGTIDASTGTALLTVGFGDASSEFDGVIQNSGGTLSLDKIGAGTFILGGENSYSGPTEIIGGVLQAGAEYALSPYSDVTVGQYGTARPERF